MDIWAFHSIISKVALYLGILFSSGAVFYVVLFETEKAKSSFSSGFAIMVSASVGMVASFVAYGIQAARLTGEAASMLEPEMLGILWETSVGTVLVMQVVGLMLILGSVFLGTIGKVFGIIGSILTLASFTQIGHVTNIASILPKILLLIHLMGISLWVGILLPLFKLSSDVDLITTTGGIAHKFGKIASGFVPVLLLAGGWLAFELVSSMQNLLFTGYGQALLAKIVLVMVLLGLAAANKLRFVTALLAEDITALSHLRSSVQFEILLVFLMLIMTAILTSVLTLPEV